MYVKSKVNAYLDYKFYFVDFRRLTNHFSWLYIVAIPFVLPFFSTLILAILEVIGSFDYYLHSVIL